MEFKKQVLVSFVILAIAISSALAACADRREDGEARGFYEELKCGLSTAGDKIKETVSDAGVSIKEGTKKALDVVTSAASKTGEVIKDGFNIAVESSKTGYEYVKDKFKSPTSEASDSDQTNFDVNKFPERVYDDKFHLDRE